MSRARKRTWVFSVSVKFAVSLLGPVGHRNLPHATSLHFSPFPPVSTKGQETPGTLMAGLPQNEHMGKGRSLKTAACKGNRPQTHWPGPPPTIRGGSGARHSPLPLQRRYLYLVGPLSHSR